ncbi:hypothetical protein CONLIGDRAFT_644411 [Coniochaeta ligniaria NRRL 30616]|uniref:Uncharacterized protein n=1 Tax=Coniochaeta ligniaria NRRL 30616 TaxID=1408157 RepID=A0A1J7IKX4_9PEZI|nr:hypothetical protein CONLIGDRAFT_644411 [Coniochaeta ligniaria NRRL 30616]
MPGPRVAEARPQASPICVRVTFTRVISLKQRDTLTQSRMLNPRFHPSHDWFDALDPLSYTFHHNAPNLGNRWPSCKNPDCRNYFLLRSTSACPDAEKPYHKLWPLEPKSTFKTSRQGDYYIKAGRVVLGPKFYDT